MTASSAKRACRLGGSLQAFWPANSSRDSFKTGKAAACRDNVRPGARMLLVVLKGESVPFEEIFCKVFFVALMCNRVISRVHTHIHAHMQTCRLDGLFVRFKLWNAYSRMNTHIHTWI